MNVSSSHDAPRLLTDIYNPNKYKFKATPNDDPGYKTGRPDKETYQRLRLYLAYEFTTIGAPQIWNGEEMGMWGADDPHCRKPLWWKEFSFEPETRSNFQPGGKSYDPVGFNQEQYDWYQKLIRIRKENPLLSTGKFDFLVTEGKKLVYKRFDTTDEIVVLFNLESSKQTFDVTKTGNYMNLLTNDIIKKQPLTLNPMTVAVLKRVK